MGIPRLSFVVCFLVHPTNIYWRLTVCWTQFCSLLSEQADKIPHRFELFFQWESQTVKKWACTVRQAGVSDTREKKARKGTWSAGVLGAGGLQLYLLEWSERAVLGKWHSRKDLGKRRALWLSVGRAFQAEGTAHGRARRREAQLACSKNYSMGKVVE